MLQTYPLINFEGLNKRRQSAMKAVIEYAQTVKNKEDYENTKEFKTRILKQIKKMQKVNYIEKNVHSFEFKPRRTKVNYLINHFTVQESYEYWKNVYVFNTTDIELVKLDLEEMGIEIDGSSWSSPYDCTGRTFYRSCDFIELSDRIIVTQSGALDV